MFWNKAYFIDIKLTSDVIISSKSEDLNIQKINIVYLQFDVNEVINTLTLHNTFYTLLIMFNIILTEFLKNKDFIIIIWKKNSTLYRFNGMKLAILNLKHKFMIFQEAEKVPEIT